MTEVNQFDEDLRHIAQENIFWLYLTAYGHPDLNAWDTYKRYIKILEQTMIALMTQEKKQDND